MNWDVFFSFLYDGVVVGIFGTPLYFGLFMMLFSTWFLSLIGVPIETTIFLLLGFAAIFIGGSIVSNPAGVVYLQGWVKGAIVVLAAGVFVIGLARVTTR